MGEEKIHSLYLQQKDTSSRGPHVYSTVPYGNHGLHKPQQTTQDKKTYAGSA